MPLTALVVKTTVAAPLASVALVALANDPPFVLDQVTVSGLAVARGPCSSAACAVMVTVPPAATLGALDVTMYLVGVRGTGVMVGPEPLIGSVVPVMISGVPGVVLVVNCTVAMPLVFVVLVGLEKDPPPVLDQVTTLPKPMSDRIVGSRSASCAR